MITYRPFRNTDPPALLEIWNACVTNRGGFPVRVASMLERWIFAKPYFNKQSLLVAESKTDEGTSLVGFSLAGFGTNEDQTESNTSQGIICCVLVKPDHRRKGIGRELMNRTTTILQECGAQTIIVGAQSPLNPFLFGVYGGGNSPGVLDTDTDAPPFLAKLGYVPNTQVTVFQRKLDKPLDVADPRFNMLRKRYDVQLLKTSGVGTWWQECVWGGLEPAEFRAVDKLTNMPAARATAWELEGFGWKWNAPSAGIIDVQVRGDLRRMGLAKYLVTHILRFLQDQYFGIAELQVKTLDEAGVKLCKSVGFEPVDSGWTYAPDGANSPAPMAEPVNDSPS
ncbi:MAG: GNAT family N-acetyltransferase [Gemmataceae bacterium]